MDQKPPSTSASSWLNRRSPAPDERETEIVRLKERLGFYESFDQVIQENVARSSELLRQAMAMRESVDEQAISTREAVEQAVVAERQNQRSLLSGLLDEVTSMQVQFERIARRVADALDDVESSLPTSVDIERLPSSTGEPVAALAAAAHDLGQDSAAVAETGENPAPELQPEAAESAQEAETYAAAAEASELNIGESTEAIESPVAETDYVFATTTAQDHADATDTEDLPDQWGDSGEAGDVFNEAELIDSPADTATIVSASSDDAVANTGESEGEVIAPEIPAVETGFPTPYAVDGDMLDVAPNAVGGDESEAEWFDDATTEAEAVAGQDSFVADIAPEVTAESVLDQFSAAEQSESSTWGAPSDSDSVAGDRLAFAETDADEIAAGGFEAESSFQELAESAPPVWSAPVEVDASLDETATPTDWIAEEVIAADAEALIAADRQDATDDSTGIGMATEADITDAQAEAVLNAGLEPPDALETSVGEAQEAAFDQVAAEIEANAASAPPDEYNLDEVLGNSRSSDPIDLPDTASSVDVTIDEVAPASDDAPVAVESLRGDAETAAPQVAETDAPVVDHATPPDEAAPASSASAGPPPVQSGGPSAWYRQAAPPAAPSTAEQPSDIDTPLPPGVAGVPADVRPFSSEGIVAGVRRPGTGELRNPTPQPRPEGSQPSNVVNMPPRGISTVVLVHGVPRATTALSLKRYLEGLQHVGIVEPREYAEGILRLHVIGTRPVNIDDLRGWADGSGLEPVHLRDDLVEVRLPH